jgi:hypothetical protein
VYYEIVFIDMGGAVISQYDYGESDFAATGFCTTCGSLSSKFFGVVCISLSPVSYVNSDEWSLDVLEA